MSIHRAWGFVLALTCIALPQTAAAQRAYPRTRVRVVDTATARPLLTGEFVRTAGDTVIIMSAGWIPTPFVVGTQHRLEISIDTHRKTWTGIGFGLLLGATTGAVVGLMSYREPDCSRTIWCFDFGPGMNALGGAFVGAIPGVVIGGIVGANTKHETWVPTRTGQFTRFNLGLSLGFD